MPYDILVTLDARCNECDNEVKIADSTDRRGVYRLSIVPCKKCLDEAKDDGDSAGYIRGMEESETTE